MNINIKDLRIGNLLRDNGDGSGVHIVEGIRTNGVREGFIESSTYPFVSPFNYQPIIFNLRLIRLCEFSRKTMSYFVDYDNVKKFPSYLHQAQNLYYSLTGEELKIDIDKLNKLINNKHTS